MIVNINQNKTLITLDFRLKELRVLKEHKEIYFIKLTNTEIESLNYLWNKDKQLFLYSVESILKSFESFKLKLNPLTIKDLLIR